MAKHDGNRTGRQAKRRRRRHERRLARGRVGALALRPGFFSVDRHIGVDLAAGPDCTVMMPQRAGKTARMAEIAELWRRPGRVVVSRPPPDLAEERPLTDAELALRYALERAFSGLDGWRGLSAGYGGGSSDWSATYLPPKDGE